MPINVQPSIVTDPAAVIQRSAQVQNESAAEAFRRAQAGQQAGQAGMDTAVKSAAALADQRAATERQKSAQNAALLRQGMSSMTQVARDYRQEKNNLAAEQRRVDRQMDDEKFETHTAAMAAIEQARIDAMDENGEVSPEFQAKYDSAIAGLNDSMQHDTKAKWIDGLAPALELRGMAASVSRKRMAEGQDALDRQAIVQQQQAADIESETKIVAGTIGAALQSTNTLEGIERYANAAAAAAKSLPDGATNEQRADAALNAMAYPVYSVLDEGGRKFYDAYHRNDREAMLHLVETGQATPSEVEIVAGFAEGMGERMVGPDGGAQTTGVQEVSGRLDPAVRSIAMDRWSKRNVSLLYVKNKAEALRSRYIERAANAMHGEANAVANETGIPEDELLAEASALIRSDRKAPTGADATPLSPGAGAGGAVQAQLDATGMQRPTVQPTQAGGEMGPPAPMDELREALDTVETSGLDEKYGKSPEERMAQQEKLKKAARTILKEVARNKLFVSAIGGNQADADRLAKLVKSKEALASTTAMRQREMDRGARLLQEHVEDTSGALGKLWYQVSGAQAERAEEYLPAKVAKSRTPEQLSQDVALAEMVRQGVLTKGRALRITREMGPGAKQALLAFLSEGGARITTPDIREAVREVRRSKLTREAEARR